MPFGAKEGKRIRRIIPSEILKVFIGCENHVVAEPVLEGDALPSWCRDSGTTHAINKADKPNPRSALITFTMSIAVKPNPRCAVVCCDGIELPTMVSATFTGGSCGVLAGGSPFTLEQQWAPGTHNWHYDSETFDPCRIQIGLGCTAEDLQSEWNASIALNDGSCLLFDGHYQTVQLLSCDPLHIIATDFAYSSTGYPEGCEPCECDPNDMADLEFTE